MSTATAPRSKIDVYSLSNFILDNDASDGKDKQSNNRKTQDVSLMAKLLGLKTRYERDGSCVRTVDAVIMCHVHKHPHILLLRHRMHSAGVLPLTGQFGTSGAQATFKLPGGKCRRDESEVECLYRKLGRVLLGENSKNSTTGDQGGGSNNNRLSSSNADGISGGDVSDNNNNNSGKYASSSATRVFRIGEVLSQWYRPNFDKFMYPYLPAHVTHPKESRTVFLVHVMALDGDSDVTARFVVSNPGLELVAVPLFELYDNAGKYGTIAASIPHAVSRLQIYYC